MTPGAVVYLRVSSEEQLSNLSLATQEKACREYCARHGLEVLEVFRDEGVSAKTAARAELQELILFVEGRRRDVTAVVVYQLSRFARNQFDHFALRLRLQRAGVGLRSVTEPVDDTPTGRLLEGVMAAVAEFDNQAKAARTVAGMREAIARGRWPWVAPIGYRHRARNPDGSPGGLEVDEALAHLVRRAFERVAGGATIEEARRDVTAAGLRAASGQPLSRQTFHRM
ncbi:MAG: recombinase family protein, partial [Thermoanaerobaculia bacterium]|nr:recombinase family protein [Thermoanaerobaculia bacterium]